MVGLAIAASMMMYSIIPRETDDSVESHLHHRPERIGKGGATGPSKPADIVEADNPLGNGADDLVPDTKPAKAEKKKKGTLGETPATCLSGLPFESGRKLAVLASAKLAARWWSHLGNGHHEHLEVLDRMMIFVHDGSAFSRHQVSEELVQTCSQLFPGRLPIAWGSQDVTESRPVCMLAKTKSGDLRPVYWSDFNQRRGVPNFVAYVAAGLPKASKVKRKWKTLCAPEEAADCPLGDRSYRPGNVIPINASHCTLAPDDACKSPISTRGHMATLSTLAWEESAAKSTNTFVNTAPSRQPFDRDAWNRRERQIQKHARERGPLFVVTGTSPGADGMAREGVEVPSMFWSVVLDAATNQTAAWTCRNGLSQQAPCHCADGLQTADVEERVGVKLFPGVRSTAPLEVWA